MHKTRAQPSVTQTPHTQKNEKKEIHSNSTFGKCNK